MPFQCLGNTHLLCAFLLQGAQRDLLPSQLRCLIPAQNPESGLVRTANGMHIGKRIKQQSNRMLLIPCSHYLFLPN